MEEQVGSAFVHYRLTLDPLDELAEWIESSRWQRGGWCLKVLVKGDREQNMGDGIAELIKGAGKPRPPRRGRIGAY